jgi:ankyrin repeat protein
MLVKSILYEKIVNINEPNINNNNTPLMYACQSTSLKLVELLIDNNADIKLKNCDGQTALHIAAREGNIDIIKLLINTRIRINKVDNEGKTALEYALYNNHVDAVNYLIKKGARSSLIEGMDL